MLIAVRPPEAGVMKDSVPDYTLNRNRTISPSSPAEYIPRGPRIEKQSAEVNSAGWQGFVGQNACTAQERRPACGGSLARHLYLDLLHRSVKKICLRQIFSVGRSGFAARRELRRRQGYTSICSIR